MTLFPAPPPQVNGKSVVGMMHTEVVAAIKAGGDETSMLVVDEDTDEFFRSCRVLPTEEHLTGRTLRDHVGETVGKCDNIAGQVSVMKTTRNTSSSFF